MLYDTILALSPKDLAMSRSLRETEYVVLWTPRTWIVDYAIVRYCFEELSLLLLSIAIKLW